MINAEVEEKSIVISRSPDAVLDEAHKAAAALAKVINAKAKPVRFNGETYLELEDWLTIARFYGISPRVVSTSPVTFGDVHGWEARADAVHNSTGQVVSSADAMCLNDEPNWKNKPQFMLRSMAQTRASAKALRNVLAWVVVLAGYKPTPAEEMDGVRGFADTKHEERQSKRERTPEELDMEEATLWRKRIRAKQTECHVADDALRGYAVDVLKGIGWAKMNASQAREMYEWLCANFDPNYKPEPQEVA